MELWEPDGTDASGQERCAKYKTKKEKGDLLKDEGGKGVSGGGY